MDLKRIEQYGLHLLEQVDDTSRTVVWKATQKTLDRTVIVRMLKPEAAARPAEVDHFLSISRLFARIKSDSLAAVFDIVSEADLHYVIMEHVDGPSLEELVTRQGPLPNDHILRIAASLIHSLEQMWQTARLVHRNLKSAIIRMDARGVAKITDFSLAIQGGTDADATIMDGEHIVGTPCFLSPEQAQGSRLLRTQSDMYALGVILYHLATGHVPFEDREPVSVLAGHVQEQIPPPHRLNPRAPVRFSWFVHRLLMKNPNNRYPDWDEALQDIRLMLANENPRCIRPDEEFLSTIQPDFEEPDVEAEPSPGDADRQQPDATLAASRIRLSRKHRDHQIAAYQGRHLAKGHFLEIQRDDLIRALVCWTLLAAWLLLVFWFRAVYQANPTAPQGLLPLTQLADAFQHVSESFDDLKILPRRPTSDDATSNGILTAGEPRPLPPSPTLGPPEPSQPAAVEPVAVIPPPPPTPEARPPEAAPPAGMPDSLRHALAKAFAAGDLAAARQQARAWSVPFKEQAELVALLDATPDPDALVAAYLRARIGRPIIFEHGGRQRTVIPRAIEDGMVQLEANGRGAGIPIASLSADEKLRWMERPATPAEALAYCLTLLRSSRHTELNARAAACPLLQDVILLAATLAPPAGAPPAAE